LNLEPVYFKDKTGEGSMHWAVDPHAAWTFGIHTTDRTDIAAMSSFKERVLIIRHGAFGDIVQSDGAFQDIREHCPDAEITLLTTPPFARLMERCPHVDRVELDERAPFSNLRRLLQLRRRLQGQQYSMVFDLQCSDRTNLYRRVILAGIPWIGSDKRSFPLVGRKRPVRPALFRYADLLQSAGVPLRHTLAPDVSWMAEDMTGFLAQEGVRKPFIALIPGCSAKHPHKRWPYYHELATRLLEQGYDVVTAPGPDELDLAATIPGHRLLGPRGFLDWFQLAGVLQQAAFVVGNDTGPSHIAACLNRPGLALFGPHTSAERTGIRRERFDAIEVLNLAQLTVERVLEEVLRRLAIYSNSV
jgi:ADP-heptose:LPS heptosyltransferase